MKTTETTTEIYVFLFYTYIFSDIIYRVARFGKPRKPEKVREIKIGNGKIRRKYKKVWNFEIYLQLYYLYITYNCLNIISNIYIVKYIQNLCILNDFNKMIKIYIFFNIFI